MVYWVERWVERWVEEVDGGVEGRRGEGGIYIILDLRNVHVMLEKIDRTGDE